MFKVMHWLTAVLILWFLFISYHYLSVFGGDPEIHLIFAKNLLAGHPLEFNPGYKSGGETSPIYMLVVAFLMLVGGDYTQYLMKVVGVVSLMVSAALLYQASGAPCCRQRLFLVALFMAMPFVPFQSLLGMENFLFSSLLLWLVYRIYGDNWPHTFSIPFICVSMYFLRPEAVLIPLWLMTTSLVLRKKPFVIASLVAIVAVAISYLLFNYMLGIDAQNAGAIRAFTSRIGAFSFKIDGLTIYMSSKPLIGCVYAAPLVLLLLAHRRRLQKIDFITLFFFVFAPFLLHLLTLFPSTHFSRYFIYCYVVLFFVFGTRILGHLHQPVTIALGIFFLLVSVSEYNARDALAKFSVTQSVESFREPSIRRKSDVIYEELFTGDLPITIAMQEVQLRGRLDDRFLVWSLDGITGSALTEFVGSNYIDHFSYLKYRNIQYLVGLPNYNIDRSKESLRDFRFDQSGRSQCIRGISLSRTGLNTIYKVSQCHT